MRHVAGSIIGWTWVAVGFLWLVLMLRTKRTAQHRGMFFSRVPIGAVFLLLFWLGGLKHSTNGYWHASSALSVVGLVVVVLGALIAVSARLAIGTNWSGTITLKEDHELVERGPYGYIRHPIYTGLLTMYLGSAMVTGAQGLVIGAPLVVFAAAYRVVVEERLMIETFPNSYPEYRRRTKALIPFVW